MSTLLKASDDSTYSIKKPNNYNVLDLFCGCGGLSLGFKREGFHIVGGIDFDEPSIKTFSKNIGKGLIADLSDKKWIELLSDVEVDVLIGGPPCQGFSLTGTRQFDDSRNKLYNAVFVGAKALQPKVVLIENVRGMATLYNGMAKAEVVRLFEELGYDVHVKILDSANFFVPQHRLRLFFVATKKNLKFSWPVPTNEKDNYVTCREGIGDLPSMENDFLSSEADYLCPPQSSFQKLIRSGSTKIYNHQPTRHKDFVIETIRQVPEGGNYKDLPPGVGESRKFNEAWTRYHGEKPSRTIDTGHRNHFHYKHDRVPTIRENARLQSFPDDFIFEGSKTQQNRQVGNAVPVLLAQAIAKQIRMALKDESN